MLKIILTFALLALLAACTGQHPNSLDDFDFLEKGMRYQTVVDHIGEPDAEVGSGVQVYAYVLENDETVLISFLNGGLYSAQLVDKNGNIVKVLVEP
jgi:hypothetical protein